MMIPPLLIFATVAFAAPKQSSNSVALQLGTVLAAEEFCDLSYDQEKIAAYIEKTVAADDMEFASRLQLMTDGKKFQQENMSKTAKAAHCVQIRRVAKTNGFIR
ncbi:hypothetical protein [Agrobacterium sp. NPDC090273]|uniref:hypothetical protein n=1 Tax=Agrobacterium sp. NPDC090273 TaxID=3363919 RepID=UPI00383B19A1